MKRPMNEHEIEDAKHVLDWQHWTPPLFASAFCIALFASYPPDDLVARFLIIAIAGAPAGYLWIIFLRNKQRVLQDVDSRMIEIVDGAPTKVWKNRFGLCFISIDGKKIRVPTEFFKNLQESTTATIEYLPKSLIALHIKPHYGLHLK
jgi:hypothetical protein